MNNMEARQHEKLIAKMEQIELAALNRAKEQDRLIGELTSKIIQLQGQVAPMVRILSNANGFTDVLIIIVKIFGSVAVVGGGFYAIAEFFRRLNKP